jgi:streptogramin lyase
LRRIRSLLFAGLVLLGLYLAAWPVPVDPVAWQAPDDRGLSGAFAANEALAGARAISLHAHEGPEDVTVGHDGALYATTVSGTILRIDQDTAEVSEFARTGGRPLGIEATADGSLLVANAYSGIQRISPRGEVTELLAEIDGKPLAYADDLAVSSDGVIYFSDASAKFGAQAWGGTYEASLLDILEHGGHGRVISFDPRGNRQLPDPALLASGTGRRHGGGSTRQSSGLS